MLRLSMERNYFYHDQLESGRLRTKFLSGADLDAWSKFFEDSEATQFVNPDFPTAIEKADYWISRQLSRYEQQRYGLQALFDKTTNEFVGQCGLLSQEIDGKVEVEVGYHILRKFWGRGYAPEAARLFMSFGFENEQAESIISIIHIDNIRSQRVAEKNGLKRCGQTTWLDTPVFIYRMNKMDFQSRPA